MYTILTVDDDEYINDLLFDALQRENYRVLRAFSGTEAMLLLENETPDLILLDLMLPGLSGEELIKKIRGIPVIVVSAKIDVDSKVNMLLGGAADYVTKPFELKELLARVRLRLKNAGEGRRNGVITCGELTFDEKNYKVSLNGNELKLTKTELAIVKVLMLNAPNVVTKTAILDQISLETPDCVEDSLKVHISNIRKKLYEYSEKEYIENIWGIGYKILTCS